MFPDEISHLAREVVEGARRRGWTVTAAESCTGGLVSAALTDVPGASEVLERGLVTYSNGAKTALLGVPAATLTAMHANRDWSSSPQLLTSRLPPICRVLILMICSFLFCLPIAPRADSQRTQPGMGLAITRTAPSNTLR